MRRVAKRIRFESPSGEESLGERLQGATTGLPTPLTDFQPTSRASASYLRHSSSSPIDEEKGKSKLLDPIVFEGERNSDLVTSILELLRSEGVAIKGSLELQIRHEIDLELDVSAARDKRYRSTISKQGKRIDELESIVELLTGNMADETNMLSD